MGADPVTAGILIGGSLLSAHTQKEAAQDAARAQSSAADQSAQVQREALQSFRAASEPFRFAGQQSINPLLQSLGMQQIQLPQQPIFNFQTGLTANQEQSRRDQIQARLEELRNLRG